MNRKICSWDVGIKNLAYCIININGSVFNIEKWIVIDLTDQKTIKCCASLKKKGRKCSKNMWRKS